MIWPSSVCDCRKQMTMDKDVCVCAYKFLLCEVKLPLAFSVFVPKHAFRYLSSLHQCLLCTVVLQCHAVSQPPAKLCLIMYCAAHKGMNVLWSYSVMLCHNPLPNCVSSCTAQHTGAWPSTATIHSRHRCWRERRRKAYVATKTLIKC